MRRLAAEVVSRGRGTLIVMAKSPVAGQVKTRLTTGFTPAQAAALARACLRDTLDTVVATRRAGAWSPGRECVAPDTRLARLHRRLTKPRRIARDPNSAWTWPLTGAEWVT